MLDKKLIGEPDNLEITKRDYTEKDTIGRNI